MPKKRAKGVVDVQLEGSPVVVETEQVNVEEKPVVSRNNYFSRGRDDHKSNIGSRIFWAFLFIFAGGMMLLSNFGLISLYAWLNVMQFWPIILIMIGLQLVVGRYVWGKVLIVLFIVLFFGLLSVSVILNSEGVLHDKLAKYIPQSLVQVFEKTGKVATKDLTLSGPDYDSVTNREISLEMSAGEIFLSDDSSENIMSGYAQYDSNREDPVMVTSFNDKAVKIAAYISRKNLGFDWFNGIKTKLDLKLGKPELNTIVNIDLSAGSAYINFTKLKLESMDISQSAGSSEITFSEDSIPSKTVTMNVSAGSTKITVPNGTKIKVKYDVSAGSLEVLGKSIQGNGNYENSFGTGSKTLILDLDVSAGSVEVVSK